MWQLSLSNKNGDAQDDQSPHVGHILNEHFSGRRWILLVEHVKWSTYILYAPQHTRARTHSQVPL